MKPLALQTLRHYAAPWVGLGLLLAYSAGGQSAWMAALCVLALVATVGTAVHHAEVVAHKVGEPYGTLILALAITVIEVALIVSLMLSGGPTTAALARDTVFAAVMLILNGMIGLCLLGRCQPPPRAALSPARRQRRADHAGRHCRADPGAAQLHHQRERPGV